MYPWGIHHKGFLCYDHETRRTCISHNVVFIEQISYYSLQQDSRIFDVSYLPQFSSFPPVTDKSLQVYSGRLQSPPATTPASNPIPVPDPPPQGIVSFEPHSSLRHSTRISKQSNRHCLFTALDPIVVPSSFAQANAILAGCYDKRIACSQIKSQMGFSSKASKCIRNWW